MLPPPPPSGLAPCPRLWGQNKYICDVAYSTLSCLIEKRRASAQAIVQMNAVPLLIDTLGWLVPQCLVWVVAV